VKERHQAASEEQASTAPTTRQPARRRTQDAESTRGQGDFRGLSMLDYRRPLRAPLDLLCERDLCFTFRGTEGHSLSRQVDGTLRLIESLRASVIEPTQVGPVQKEKREEKGKTEPVLVFVNSSTRSKGPDQFLLCDFTVSARRANSRTVGFSSVSSGVGSGVGVNLRRQVCFNDGGGRERRDPFPQAKTHLGRLASFTSDV